MSETPALLSKTSHASALKTVFETLKDLLEDACLEFDHDGIRLVATDNTSIAMVHMRLDAERFDEFVCPHPLVVGINVPCMQKLIKSIGNSDTVTMVVPEATSSQVRPLSVPHRKGVIFCCSEINRSTGRVSFQMHIVVDNHERKTSTTFKISLMDLNHSPIEVPPVVFDSCVIMPSTGTTPIRAPEPVMPEPAMCVAERPACADMQKILRDMSGISDRVEITNSLNRLGLSCQGDFCSQETVLEESTKLQTTMTREESIIQGVYSLKHLVLFCKCSSLCSLLKINLKNDYPIVFNFSIASLGELKLCLSPMCD